jgi:hypothetical protein
MKTNRSGVGFLLAVCVLAICAHACGPDDVPEPECVDGASERTEGCDEFTRLIAVVEKNGTAQNDGDWHPLDTGDTLATNDSGEAELNFSDCWDGRLFLFDNSEGNIRVRDCHKAQYDEVSNLCIPNGTWYSGKCRGEFSATTGSVQLTKLGTSFSITALPEGREISLVVVVEGQVRVEPVLSYNPTDLGQALDVSGGAFYFTMPDAMLSDVAGLEPRVAHPVDELGAVARELGIVDWMLDVRDRAKEDGVLPDNWPPELGGAGGEEGSPTEPPAPAAERAAVAPLLDRLDSLADINGYEVLLVYFPDEIGDEVVSALTAYTEERGYGGEILWAALPPGTSLGETDYLQSIQAAAGYGTTLYLSIDQSDSDNALLADGAYAMGSSKQAFVQMNTYEDEVTLVHSIDIQ